MLAERAHWRVIVPFVPGMLHPETERAMADLPCSVEKVQLSALDTDGYARAFRSWWEDGRAFIVVEQDIVPAMSHIADVLSCPEPWCTVPYVITGRLYDRALGFARFSDELLGAHPEWGRQITEVRPGRGRWVPWYSLDRHVHHHLTGHGIDAHVHPGQVKHCHDYTAELAQLGKDAQVDSRIVEA